eukprot:scaffold8001_cov92-Skeletonema_dohrnii-CCMP3373.AAC.2
MGQVHLKSAMNAEDDLEEAEAADMMFCASCGIAEVDDIKLMTCNDCDLVRYCSDKCQQGHRPRHDAKCKERAAELRDEILFRQPESTHFGDCPICCLPLLFNNNKSAMYTCCSKTICKGCEYASKLRQTEGRLEETCPFCRHPLSKDDEESNTNIMRRIEANDPHAMGHMGKRHWDEGDYDTAFEYLSRAAELGDAHAHFLLGHMYSWGQCVEKDKMRKLYHLEEAAIAGHPFARHSLAYYEQENESFDRAMKHWIIAANLGYDKAIQALKGYYKRGLISKEDFAASLRAHQAAVDATKSPLREEAAKFFAEFG